MVAQRQEEVVLAEGEIMDGPGKWDFVMGLIEGHQVWFQLKKYLPGLGAPVFSPTIVDLQLIQLESGIDPRDNWLIWGVVLEPTGNPYEFKAVGKIEGYYNTRNRRGKYKIVS